MKSRRQIAYLLIFVALAAVVGHQTAAFSQNIPNTGYPQPVQPGTTYAPYQQPAVPQVNPPMTQPGVATGFPTGTQPVPTSGFPAGTHPGGATTGNVPQNYMIDRPLGAMTNGTVPNGAATSGMTPGLQTGNQVPVQNQNVRQLVPPPPGFSPSPEELKYINDFLTVWSQQSKTIEALDYEFTCLGHAVTAEGEPHVTGETYGRVKFRAPDKGLIEIDKELIEGKVSSETSKKMKIVCTGEAIYTFDHAQKMLTEFVIPQEQRGKGVMDSPLMILVGANPQELQERFYLVGMNPWSNNVANCCCFKAWPKWPEDLGDFKAVQLAIDKQTFHAKELLVFDPSGNGGKAYLITKTQRGIVDRLNPIAKDDFDRNTILKSMPRGWVFETKNDFIPEASGAPQYVQQPNPPYGTPVNVPNNPAMRPNVVPQNQPNPAQPQLSYNNGTPIANYTPPTAVTPQTSQYTVPQTPHYGVPQTSPSQYGGTAPVPQNQQYNMAMPPQSNTVSPSIIR